MANRRMFSKEVVQSSKFLRLPPTCRLLYYDLGMNADDDGYCEWYPVLQMSGAKEADMEILHKALLIHIFDREVLVVTDWKVNNFIRSDRYSKSKYLGKYEALSTLKSGIPNDNQTLSQVRLELGKGRTQYNDTFFEEFFWPAYPKKVSKETARKSLIKINPDAELKNVILSALKVQKETSQWTKNQGKFIPHASTWLNQKRWEDEITSDSANLMPQTGAKIEL